MPQINIGKRNSEAESRYQGYPPLGPHREKILIVAKTAPNPSDKYRETVCTAGITENGKWIRLYPIPFRYMDFFKRFHKYQWISINIERRSFKKDFRIDSYQPNCETIRLLGKPLPSGKWEERKKILLPITSSSLEEIRAAYISNKISLGVFKPKKITKFVVEEGEKNWSRRHQTILSQQVLFGKQPKELEKIPFKFSYEFECNDLRCRGHKMQIIDWEITELFRRMKKRYPFSNDLVLEKVKNQWLTTMWRENRNSYLIVGSVYPKPTFNIIGVFWPPA